jgi:hypothetical protein
MTILNDLKNFLVSNNVAQGDDIAFNFDDFLWENSKIILQCKGGEFSDIARKTTVAVIVKNKSAKSAELLINSAFDCFYPPNQYSKPININGKLMLIKPLQSPFYKEKEKNGRHVFAFDLKIIHKR